MDDYEVVSVNERQIPWGARRKLRAARRAGWTGIVAFTQIPGRSAGGSRYRRVVLIREAADTLFYAHPGWQPSKWIDLSPGEHRLGFHVGGGFRAGCVFERTVRVERGEILIVGCRTTYSLKPFDKNPRPNRWYLGVVGSVAAADGSSRDPSLGTF